MDRPTEREKTWIFYLVQFLIFGPMMGLLIFSAYITREETILMLLMALAGGCIGRAIQYLIYQKLQLIAVKWYHSAAYLAAGLMASIACVWLLNYRVLLTIGFIILVFLTATLFMIYNIRKKH